jgi:RNA polymerase sigma-70 factor (sigma-E family)
VLTDVEGSPSSEESFSAFVSARQNELVRLGWALAGDRQLGEDLAQSALQRVWPHWSRVAAAGDPFAYTQRTMVNLYASWRRRRRWQVEHVDASPPEPPGRDATVMVDEQDVVDTWLAYLPPRQRAVVVLRFLFDLDVAATADRLGCSPGTVKSQTSKALAALRKCWPGLRPRQEEASS